MGSDASSEQSTPLKHAVQLVFPRAPTVSVESHVRELPEHTAQDTVAQSDAYVFPAHMVHVVAPDTDWAVPGGQP